MFYLSNAKHAHMLQLSGETFIGMSPLLTKDWRRRLGEPNHSFFARAERLLPEKTMLSGTVNRTNVRFRRVNTVQ
jgi:hypothetical protein